MVYTLSRRRGLVRTGDLSDSISSSMEQEQGMPTKKVWESVKHYAVKCASCSKWRLVPTKEKYEEIREKIGEQLLICERAREWRPHISCDDEPDVRQDDTMRWAMDKPRIPQTPSGWQRIIRIRAEGGTKFADVYYVAPSNKRLRSMVELSRHIYEHPEYAQDGLSISQFSFQPPVPLDEKYTTKRRACSTTDDISGACRKLNTKNDSSKTSTTEVDALLK